MRETRVLVLCMSKKDQKTKLTMGSKGVMQIMSGAAKGPISPRTSKRNSLTSSSSSSVLDSVRVANAIIASPVGSRIGRDRYCCD